MFKQTSGGGAECKEGVEEGGGVRHRVAHVEMKLSALESEEGSQVPLNSDIITSHQQTAPRRTPALYLTLIGLLIFSAGTSSHMLTSHHSSAQSVIAFILSVPAGIRGVWWNVPLMSGGERADPSERRRRLRTRARGRSDVHVRAQTDAEEIPEGGQNGEHAQVRS